MRIPGQANENRTPLRVIAAASSRQGYKGPVHRRAGAAFLMVLLILLLGAGLLAGLVSISGVWHRAANATVWRSGGRYAGTGAIEYVHALLESGFNKFMTGEEGSVEDFRRYLEDATTGLNLADGATVDLTARIPALEPEIFSLQVTRVDRFGSLNTDLLVQAILVNGDETLRFNREFNVGGKTFSGMKFVMLTEDANCILCHADFDSVERFSSPDSYDPVYVGVLENLQTRSNNGASIAGDLVIKGNFTDRNGNPLSSPTHEMIHGFERDAATGQVTVDEFGSKTSKSLEAGIDFFLNTPLVDDPVEVPESFPPPFPDENGNARVDDTEYRKVADVATGALTGGVLYEVPDGSTFDNPTWPTSGTTASLSGETSGNLVLVGTQDNPIEINGNLAVDGDLVIQGWVKGSGSIWVRGNAYVAGDVRYLDGTDSQGNRTFGVADDGTPNLLGITTGGNILAGNYLFGRGASPYEKDKMIQGGPGDDSARLSFTEMEMAIFNRREFAKTQEFLPDTNGQPIANPSYDADYIPRFYTLKDGADPSVFVGGSDSSYNAATEAWEGSSFGDSYWDKGHGEWGGKEHPSTWESTITLPHDSLPGDGVLYTTSPTSNWLSADTLWSLWESYEKGKGNLDPMTIEAALYTNNMIFAMASKQGAYQGKMEINGAVVSRDMGILSTQGLKMNYDPRVGDLIRIKQWDVAAVQGSAGWSSGTSLNTSLEDWRANKLKIRDHAAAGGG